MKKLKFVSDVYFVGHCIRKIRFKECKEYLQIEHFIYFTHESKEEFPDEET